MKSEKAQTIQNYTVALQGAAFEVERCEELSKEVTALVDAVDKTSRLMDFDSEPSQYQAYIGRWEGNEQ